MTHCQAGRKSDCDSRKICRQCVLAMPWFMSAHCNVQQNCLPDLHCPPILFLRHFAITVGAILLGWCHRAARSPYQNHARLARLDEERSLENVSALCLSWYDKHKFLPCQQKWSVAEVAAFCQSQVCRSSKIPVSISLVSLYLACDFWDFL